jgi:hypothetical protein
MNNIQRLKLNFLEASPVNYNSNDNCKYERPYIIDFSPVANIHHTDSFLTLLNNNAANSIVTPYSLLIQVALGYLDGAFSLIHTGPGRSRFEDFIRGIFGAVHTRGNKAFFLHDQLKREYDLKPGWSSALTQGQALSLWLRLKVFGDTFKDLDHIGPLLLNGMLSAVEDGGGLYRDRRTEELWLEEYPSTPASHVLNGFIFALFGLIEFNIRSDLDKSDEIVSIEQKLIRTLSINIERYDKFGWSCYDLAKSNFAPTHYHIIHIFTLSYLSNMLNNDRFSVVAEKWRRGIDRNFCRLIDILRFVRKVYRKSYVTIVGRRW